MAVAQSVGINAGIWAFDRFILDEYFAYVSLNSIKTNLTHGFVWDNDQMSTNMFAHPYHGSLFYNAARSNGFNYWASGAFSVGGSLMWELFGENEYPSINDMLSTPIGGMALGEVLYRSSDLILDDRATGTERFFREFCGFLIAPTRGITRIIKGDAWRVRGTSGRQFGFPEMQLEVSVGARTIELKDPISDKAVGLNIRSHFEYGNKFSTESAKPYDFFDIKVSLNLHKSQPIIGQINLVGQLWKHNLLDNDKHTINMGIYQHFDYYDSDTISDVSSKVPYKFCTPASFGIGFFHKNKMPKKIDFDSYAHLNAILLGGSLSDHYMVGKRDYNLASGFNFQIGFNLFYKDKLRLSLNYEVYKMFTWKSYPDPESIIWTSIDDREFNYQGDKSQATLHAVELKLDIKLVNRFYITTIFNLYDRKTNYKYYDDIYSQTEAGSILLTYKF